MTAARRCECGNPRCHEWAGTRQWTRDEVELLLGAVACLVGVVIVCALAWWLP